MKRLTDEPRTMSMCMSVDECRRYNRLWEYENTGLTPDEIAAIQAERDAALWRAEAAVADLAHLSDKFHICETCKHDMGNGVSDCGRHDCDETNRYEWRGPEPGGDKGAES